MEGLSITVLHLRFINGYHDTAPLSLARPSSLSAALEALEGTRSEVEGLQAALGELRTKHEEAGRLSQSLMAELTTQACQLERTKALVGQGSSVLSAMKVGGVDGGGCLYNSSLLSSAKTTAVCALEYIAFIS